MPDLGNDRLGPTILTASGKTVHPLDLKPGDIDIADIARSLANQCRFLGHVAYYSVGQHAVNVSRVVTPENAVHGLLHDAAEAYLGDIVKPLKGLVYFNIPFGPYSAEIREGMLSYQRAEANAMKVIYSAFNLEWPGERVRGEVDYADKVVYATEDRDLRNRANDDQRVAVLDEVIFPMAPADAERWFLQRWDEVKPR